MLFKKKDHIYMTIIERVLMFNVTRLQLTYIAAWFGAYFSVCDTDT